MLLGVLGLVAACAGPDDGGKTDPIEMSQFKLGSTRIDVVGALGRPEWTVQKAGRPCDVYKIHTRGMGSGGKAAMAVAEGLTDVVTLGLAEVAWSGIRAGIKPDLHTVLFCYGQPPDDDALVDIYDKNPTVERAATQTIIDPARFAIPRTLPPAPADVRAPQPVSSEPLGAPYTEAKPYNPGPGPGPVEDPHAPQ